ncbi:MAG: sulfatase-like hydrolase/transferase [Planctomycetota bacterium]
MPRPVFKAKAAASIVLAVSSSYATLAPAEQPNVVLIMIDDAGYGDVAYQGADFPTPYIDALVTQGVRFANAHASAPQCAPSRAGLITGVHQARFGFHDNAGNRGLPAPQRVPSIGTQMQMLGYTTGVIGKWHADITRNPSIQLTANEITRNERSKPWRNGFDYTLIHDKGGSHFFPYSVEGQEWMTSRNREYRLTEVVEGGSEPMLREDITADSYLTDVFTDAAVDFIDRRADAGEPFFLFLSYNAPHTPLMAPTSDIAAVPPSITDPERRLVAAMMLGVDRGVSEVEAKLVDEGLLDNTLFIFTSDNGGPLNPGGAYDNSIYRGYKGEVYEGGTRVPLALRWNDGNILEAGQTISHPVSLIDMLPTVVAAGGGMADPITDGFDLLPYLQGHTTTFPRQDLMIQWRTQTSFRVGDDKFVDFNATIPANTNNPEELFNLLIDPSETTPLFNPPLALSLQSEIESFTLNQRDSIPVDPVEVGPTQAQVLYSFDEVPPDLPADRGFNSIDTPPLIPPSAALGVPGLKVSAIELNGVEGISLSSPLDEWKPAEDFTVVLWINVAQSPIVQTRIIDSTNINGAISGGRGWRLLINDGTRPRRLQLQVNRGVAGEQINASLTNLSSLQLDAWYFVAFRYDQDDDVSVTLLPAAAAPSAQLVQEETQSFPALGALLYGENAVPRLGAAPDGATKVPHARFDEVQLYDWSLTDDQVLELFETGRPPISTDLDGDAFATSFDLASYLAIVATGDVGADLNRDGATTATDIEIYLGMLRTLLP